jgi:hypothetical protein
MALDKITAMQVRVVLEREKGEYKPAIGPTSSARGDLHLTYRTAPRSIGVLASRRVREPLPGCNGAALSSPALRQRFATD